MKLTIRKLIADDIQVVKRWPSYKDYYAALDYSLRDRGWLDTYGIDHNSHQLGLFTEENDLIAFIIFEVDATTPTLAEGYIAVRNDYIKGKIAFPFAAKSLKLAYEKFGITDIFLKVRKDHPNLEFYNKLGFTYISDCQATYNNILVDFGKYQINLRACELFGVDTEIEYK